MRLKVIHCWLQYMIEEHVCHNVYACITNTQCTAEEYCRAGPLSTLLRVYCIQFTSPSGLEDSKNKLEKLTLQRTLQHLK